MKAALLFACALLAQASVRAAALEVEKSVRIAAWSSSRQLDDEDGLLPTQIWLRPDAVASIGHSRIKFHGEGWVEYQPTGSNRRSTGRLREAYVHLSAGPLEVRAGWQIFPWGRADAINPTDNLTPRQLTFLSRDVEDQRFGTRALRATWFSGPVSASLIWLADFEPAELPLPRGLLLSDIEPAHSSRQMAARLEVVLGEVEGSLSYFDGYDVFPTQVVRVPGVSAGALVLHERLKVIGADFAKNIGRFGVRAEAAYLEPENEVQLETLFAKQPQWYAVAGADRTFGEYLNVNLQYYYRHVARNPLSMQLGAEALAIGRAFALTAQQTEKVDQGLTYRIRQQWLNETIEVSLSGAWSLVHRGYLVRPLLKYRLSDAWSAAIGAELLGGDERTLYGFLHDNTTFYLELRRGF